MDNQSERVQIVNSIVLLNIAGSSLGNLSNIAAIYKMVKETEHGDDDCSFRNYDEDKWDDDQHKHDHYYDVTICFAAVIVVCVVEVGGGGSGCYSDDCCSKGGGIGSDGDIVSNYKRGSGGGRA